MKTFPLLFVFASLIACAETPIVLKPPTPQPTDRDVVEKSAVSVPVDAIDYTLNKTPLPNSAITVILQSAFGGRADTAIVQGPNLRLVKLQGPFMDGDVLIFKYRTAEQ